MRRGSIAALLLVLLLAALGFKGALVGVPPLPESAEPGTFAASRATGRLARILGDQRPHPVDSAANDAVRARLVAELRGLGLAPVVSDGFACMGFGATRTVGCARVRNVRATIQPAAGAAGGRAGRHVLLVSHYDSTPAGPGAADDGLGVAVALETAALLRQRRLARPVTLLFTDGEEAGLLGARHFVERDPIAASVDAVVNLEARGVTGPAIMFETSRPNAAAIDLFARTAQRPVASSMTADAYALIPNATDVNVFAGRGWTILNFAIIGNESRYHSADDRLERLDRRSVAHMGQQALAATAALAAAPAQGAAPADGGTVLYADLLGRILVVLPAWLGLALLAALIAGLALLAWRRRRGLGRPAATIGAGLVASVMLAVAGQALVSAVKPGLFWRARPELISTAVDASAIAACLAVFLWLRPADRMPARAAFWLIFVALGGLIALAAPGGMIFFLAPPLVALAGMLIGPRAERIAALLAWALLLLSWAPLLHLAQVLLDFRAAWLFAPVAALLVLPLVIELAPLLYTVPRREGLAVAAGFLLLGWGVAAEAPAYSLERKQNFRIEYGLDADSGTARWLVAHDGGRLPAAFAGFLPRQEVPWSPAPRSGAPAPALPLPRPIVTKLGERPVQGGRLVTLRIATGGADSWILRSGADGALKSVSAGGAVVPFGKGSSDEAYGLRCQGRRCDGLTLNLLIGGAGPVEITLIALRSGLPQAAAPLVRARPADAAPQYAPDSSYVWSKARI